MQDTAVIAPIITSTARTSTIVKPSAPRISIAPLKAKNSALNLPADLGNSFGSRTALAIISVSSLENSKPA
jgi:hypothetical protein